MNINEDSITAIYKWDCDGGSGHSTYPQQFFDTDSLRIDENIFALCIVTMQLKIGDVILWENSRPSSTRFCRPIKSIFEKESSELAGREVEALKK